MTTGKGDYSGFHESPPIARSRNLGPECPSVRTCGWKTLTFRENARFWRRLAPGCRRAYRLNLVGYRSVLFFLEVAVVNDRDVSTAVADPLVETIRRRRQQRQAQTKRQPRYHVILWNDEDHSYDYVIVMMRELFGHPVEKGFQIADEVDAKGRAVCLTTTREHAELKRDQIHAYGRDSLISRCQGSMSASIEPEET